MIVANIIHRVKHIGFADATGTGFVADVDGRQYSVTAKHVVEDFRDGDALRLFSRGSFADSPAKLIGHCDTTDVSVLAWPTPLVAPNLPAELTTDGLIFAQDAYFLGFPFGLRGDLGALNAHFPMPFAKKAIISMMDSNGSFWLDGIANPGFSGGPVVFQNPQDRKWRIAGVVSGYLPDDEEITIDGQDSGLRYGANTGLIEAVPIEKVLTLIKANPSGLLLPT